MKRFFKEAAVEAAESGYRVCLDGRPVRTPGRMEMILPTAALAAASAAEWNGQGDKLDMATMPMTAFAYAAIERVSQTPETFIEEIARIAQTDLVCYRAASPALLRQVQDAAWSPLLAWLRDRHGAALTVVDGIMPVAQPPKALDAIQAQLDRLDPYRLTAGHAAAQVAGSAVVALALLDGRLDALAASQAAEVDLAFQLEHWGEDADARKLLTRRQADMADIGAFIESLR